MIITDKTNTTVQPQGIGLANWLNAQLTAFAVPANAPGTNLLAPLLGNQAVEVVIKDAGAIATSGTRITVNKSLINGIGAEFVESVIFELTNAKNSAGFALLEQNLKTGAVSLRGYGRAKADLEAEASWNLVQIMNAQQGYVPSAFGAGHIAAVNAANLADFQGTFRTARHDPNAVNTSPMWLRSEEMYAYNGAVILASNSGFLNAALSPVRDTRSGAPKSIYCSKLKDALGQQIAPTVNTQQPKNAARFYWVLIEALRVAQVTPPWPHGGIAEWEFTADMQGVAPDTPTSWQSMIAGWITNKNAAIYTQ